MNFGPFFFAAPWALAALVALPALFWILRASPPPPRRTLFPPTPLLEGLSTEEQTRESAPLWLLLLRALILVLAIIGFARPSLAPQTAAESAGGKTLIVIDDGWTSASFWPDVRAAALDAVAQAERGGGSISFLLTAPEIPARAPDEVFTPAAARAFLARIEPKPWRPDRTDAARRFAQTTSSYARILWIADGLNDDGARALGDALKPHGPVTARLPIVTAHAVANAETSGRGVEVEVRRAPGGPESIAVAAETLEGHALGAGEARFGPGDANARTHIALPPEIAARAARVRLTSETSAGATRLLASGAGRPFVGLVDNGGDAQALVSDVFYLDRALSPYAGLERGQVDALLNANVQAIIAPDSARLTAADRSALDRWVRRGGLLVRFAGPRLANESDDLLPVRLRPGARALGGALAWEQAQSLAPFSEQSPFAGLTPPADVLVRAQVTAEPLSLQQASVWASLKDGSPVVTAAPRGEGLIVLFHVSAGPAWSDLPLSGLYVDMLRRTLAFAGRTQRAENTQNAAGPYLAERLLDGFGVLAPADADAASIPADRFNAVRAGPEAPPGLYTRSGLSAALNPARDDEALSALDLAPGIARARLGQREERPLAWIFLGGAALLLALDLLIALWLSGKLPLPTRRAAASAATLLSVFILFAPQAHADPNDPTQTLRLAYVRTGDSDVDATSRAGLEALSQILRERTAVEPGAPIAIDLARDDLSALPFLYWPASNNPEHLSDAALENLGRYLSIGGLLLLDTREMGHASPRGREPAALMLAGLGVPPLEPVTTDHVAARAFYLLRSFTGHTTAAHLWAESSAAAASRDGVAALFIGDGDWAAAWSGRADLPGGARQRELALRFGVNLVMVALTGNYKADQVHVPALLERLGREAR